MFGLNRFGGAPGGGPGTNTSIEARGRFFGFGLFGAARGADFFGMRSCVTHSFRLANDFILPSFFFRFRSFGLLQIVFILLAKSSLKPLQPYTDTRLIDSMIHCFVQNREI